MGGWIIILPILFAAFVIGLGILITGIVLIISFIVKKRKKRPVKAAFLVVAIIPTLIGAFISAPGFYMIAGIASNEIENAQHKKTIEYAAYDRDWDRVTELLSKGADPNEYAHTPPLEYAVNDNNIEMIKLLLEYGAIPERAALASACFDKNYEAAELLLEHGADPNERRNGGETVLFDAVRNSHSENSLSVVKLLVRYGADVNAATDGGETVLDFANWFSKEYYSEIQYKKIAAYLIAIGAATGTGGNE